MNAYKTLAAPATGEYKEKGSRFIGYAFNVESPDEVKAQLTEVKREHAKARHHCYAYRLGTDGNQHRASDDGEPSGTAGKPILGQIDSFGLTDVLIVVVRYFGGVLLGASGLNHAYKSAARLALASAHLVEKEITFGFRFHFPADALPQVMTLMKKHRIKTTVPQFDGVYTMEAFVPAAVCDALVDQLNKHGVTAEPL